MPFKIEVDRDVCMGSGQCLIYAANTFDQDDEAVAVVVDPSGDPDDAISLAADNCPTNAITITRIDAGSDS